MNRVIVRVEGVSPLLMNRMTEAELEGIRTKEKKKFKAAPPADPRDQAAPKVYTTKDGNPYIPAENFMACLIAAGMYIKLDGKRQMSTSKSTLLPGFMTLETPWLSLVSPHNDKPAPWEVDIRKGTNPNGGEAVCLVRPRFDAWAFDCSLLVDTDQINEKVIREMVDIAGARVGLGDFRPARKGIFGRFKVVLWEREALTEAAE